jgi:putative Holliday junction resolvase
MPGEIAHPTSWNKITNPRRGKTKHSLSRYTGHVTALSNSTPPAAKILALDYGRRKIGLALADSEARIAEPFTTLERINRNEDMRRLRELARDHHVRQIIVGLPLCLDGTPGEMAEEATRFAERLRKQLGLPVELIDERLTSWEAERVLEEELGRRITHTETHTGRKKSTRASDGKYTVDAVAAMLILREYLARTCTSVAKEPV